MAARSRYRRSIYRLLLPIALLAAGGMFYLVISPDPASDSSESGLLLERSGGVRDHKSLECDIEDWGTHRLAVIVPFRDRLDELMQFAPYIHRFLCQQHIRHQLFVVSQSDPFRFNRGALVNAGFLIIQNSSFDYVAVHDVDLLPVNENISYEFPSLGPLHISSPQLHPKYHYDKFLGGILLISHKHFRQVNGFSNSFWGWGREDDEFYKRIQDAGLTISRPEGITTGNKTFRHLHDNMQRPRDSYRYGDQKAYLRRDRVTGVSNIEYSVMSRHHVVIDGVVNVTIISVHLSCHLEATPWCLAPRQLVAAVRAERTRLSPQEFEQLEDSLRQHGMHYELPENTN